MSDKDNEIVVSEETNKEELNKIKGSKISSKLRKIINDSRYDDYKMIYNLYAVSMGYSPPNKLSYEDK